MERVVSALEAQLEGSLEEIGREQDLVLRYDRSVKRVRVCIEEMKDYLRAHPFAGIAEEIEYFKELAPRVYSRLFFYMKLFQVESFRRFAGREQFREALEAELAGIGRFFAQHGDVCKYYYQQTRYWDEELFTRRGREDWPVDDISIILDADFSLGSYWVSWIKANERLRGWLEQRIVALDEAGCPEKKEDKLQWVLGETDLVEVAKALHVRGAFGKVTFKRVIERMARNYGVEVKNHDNVLQEIGRRKKSRTKFIDEIREGLLRKMDEDLLK